MDDRRWHEASIEEKQAVIDTYNTYYGEGLTLEIADDYWYNRRWITIKYTFGVEPM